MESSLPQFWRQRRGNRGAGSVREAVMGVWGRKCVGRGSRGAGSVRGEVMERQEV